MRSKIRVIVDNSRRRRRPFHVARLETGAISGHETLDAHHCGKAEILPGADSRDEFPVAECEPPECRVRDAGLVKKQFDFLSERIIDIHAEKNAGRIPLLSSTKKGRAPNAPESDLRHTSRMTDARTRHDLLVARIRSFMETRRLKARRLSVDAGLHPDAVRTILRGRSLAPRMETLEALAAFMKVPVKQLFSPDPEIRMPWEIDYPQKTSAAGLAGESYRAPAGAPPAVSPAIPDEASDFGHFVAAIADVYGEAGREIELAELAAMAFSEWPNVLDAGPDPADRGAASRALIARLRRALARERAAELREGAVSR